MVDYTEVIELVAEIIKLAIPIGLVLSLSEWATKFFIDSALGRLWKGAK